MKIVLVPKLKARAGYDLALTLTFVVIALAALSSIMHWVASSNIVSERNNLYVSAQAAAESATEGVITRMMRDFTYSTLKSASDYSALVPDTSAWPIQFIFKSTNGVAQQTSVAIGGGYWTQLPSQFKGLYGYGQDCTVASTATTSNTRYAVSSTVSQSVWFGNIPLFQFAIFYNQDMEINPGASMRVNGRVHSNYNIWATGSSSSSPLIFTTSVDASGFVTNTPSPLDPQNFGHRSGNGVYSDTNSPISNSDTLVLPIGTDSDNNPAHVTSILRLPPNGLAAPQASAYSTNGQVYLYNEADLIVSNSPSGINSYSSTNVMTVYYQNQNNASPLVRVSPDVSSVQTVPTNSYSVTSGYVTNMIPSYSYTTNIVYYISGKNKGKIQSITVITNTAYTPEINEVNITNVTTYNITVTNYFYSFVTNVTYRDYRESKTVQAVQVDVANLNTWLANSDPTVGGLQYDQMNTSGSTYKGHGINSIYVQNDVSLDSSTLPAVRLVNGQQLPSSGLTVATALPIYVKGDYNTTTDGSHYSKALGDTTYTRPAALLGDAISLLSANWKDNYNASTSLSSRTPANICLNAATLEGIVPSDGSHYSGGVENFLRLLENWSGYTVTYNGSIVVMFPSQYATSPWKTTGNYYNAPSRQWGFDPNFQDSTKLPPLTPQLKATVRGFYVTR